jgi:hypothetical protein
MSIEALKIVMPQYPILQHFPNFAAWSVPIVELLVVVLLFFPRTKLLGLYASLGLMTAFTLYLAYMLSNVTKMPCTCGGMLQAMTWPQHIIFNIFFIVLAITAIILKRKKHQDTDNMPRRFQHAHS